MAARSNAEVPSLTARLNVRFPRVTGMALADAALGYCCGGGRAIGTDRSSNACVTAEIGVVGRGVSKLGQARDAGREAIVANAQIILHGPDGARALVKLLPKDLRMHLTGNLVPLQVGGFPDGCLKAVTSESKYT